MKKLKTIIYWTEQGRVDEVEFDRVDIPWWMPKWLFFKGLSNKLKDPHEEDELIRDIFCKVEKRLKENDELKDINLDDISISIRCSKSKMFMFMYIGDEKGAEIMYY